MFGAIHPILLDGFDCSVVSVGVSVVLPGVSSQPKKVALGVLTHPEGRRRFDTGHHSPGRTKNLEPLCLWRTSLQILNLYGSEVGSERLLTTNTEIGVIISFGV